MNSHRHNRLTVINGNVDLLVTRRCTCVYQFPCAIKTHQSNFQENRNLLWCCNQSEQYLHECWVCGKTPGVSTNVRPSSSRWNWTDDSWEQTRLKWWSKRYFPPTLDGAAKLRLHKLQFRNINPLFSFSVMKFYKSWGVVILDFNSLYWLSNFLFNFFFFFFGGGHTAQLSYL